jgi:hypothetical protein
MKIHAQCLAFFSLGHLAASQSEQSYLRRRAKAAKKEVAPIEFEPVKPLLASDVLQLTPSETISESGITLNESTYSVGDDVGVQFEVSPEYYVDSEVSLNLTNVESWSVGIYMHMADPQGGALPPIVSLKPEIEYGRDSTMSGSVTFGSDVVHFMEGSDPTWPLDTIEYGTGFDVWLLDENGAAIIGPEWFMLEPLEDIQVNGFMESDVKVHPLMQHGHADTKQDFSEEGQQVEINDSSFALSTDKSTYTSDDRIQISYIIGEQSSPAVDTDKLILFNPPAIEDEMEITKGPEDSMEHSSLFDPVFESSDADFDADFAPELEVQSTPSYFIGIWMKMARPQGGSLAPIVSVPVDQSSGTVQFNASELDTLLYGTGFDAWIVDQDGNEVFGPVFLSIPDADEEAPLMTSY